MLELLLSQLQYQEEGARAESSQEKEQEEINLITMNISIIFIVLISTISQCGDLIVSYFKRLKKLNDTGKILPGHGGILDRIDGMIFAIPGGYLVNILIL